MQTVKTSFAPAAIGPYSQGTIVGNMLFSAGQIPLDPKTMEIVKGGVEEQAKQVLKNLDAILLEAGSSWGKVVKATVFMVDLSDFGIFNSVYEQHLLDAKPARSTVQVAALPKGALIEIEVVAEVDP